MDKRKELTDRLKELTCEDFIQIRGRKHCIPIYRASSGTDASVYDYADYMFFSNLKKTEGILIFKDNGVQTFAVDTDTIDLALLETITEGMDDLVIDDAYLDFAEEDFIERALRKAGFKLIDVDRWLMEGFNGETLYYDVIESEATLGNVHLSDELINRIKTELNELEDLGYHTV